MAEQSFQEKTEPATPKRREEIRHKGQVAKSVEISSAAVLLAGTLMIFMTGGQLMSQLGDVMRDFLSFSFGTEVDQQSVMSLVNTVLVRLLVIVAPVILTIMLVGLVSNIAQVGLVFSIEPLTPKPDKMNPLSGLKKVGFSQQSLIELSKSILKVSLVTVVGYLALKSLVARSVQLVDSSPAEVFTFMGKSAFSVAMKISSAFAVLAGTDYYFQRKKFQHDTKMSKQEIREETKQSEGDPAVKGRIKREMVKRSRLRMMQAVPKADVVVTNPTHYAIAIQYDPKQMAAPKVVAKGKDLLAQRIKEIAAEHRVPIYEDKPLAQLLYKSVDIDEQIPPELFKAVAQILAYIYKMSGTKRSLSRN